MELAPCPACHRHASTHERACPFCGAALAGATPVRRTLVGRASRAAVFASAATLAGCYTDAKTTTPPPPPPPPDGTLKQPPPDGDGRDFSKPPAAGLGSITGTLANAPGRMHIVAQGPDRRAEVDTDANGAFRLTDLKPGWYVVTFQPSNHPRRPPNETRVEVKAGEVVTANGTYWPPPPPDRGPCCKPYGAPPARRRVV